MSATLHLVAQSRVFLHQLDAIRHEIGSLHDERASELVKSLDCTLREPPGQGTLRRVEAAASGLLRSLRDDGAL